MSKTFTITISKDGNTSPVPISLNGRMRRLHRGTPEEVSKEEMEILDHSYIEYTVAGDDKGGETTVSVADYHGQPETPEAKGPSTAANAAAPGETDQSGNEPKAPSETPTADAAEASKAKTAK